LRLLALVSAKEPKISHLETYCLDIGTPSLAMCGDSAVV
jgi:hypothetical protein